MKVSQIPYKRYTVEEGRAALEEFRALSSLAACADDMLAARAGFIEKMYIEYSTAASLANCRFTLNTKDEFYQAEMAYYDEAGPLFEQIMTEYAAIMLDSKYRGELETKMNPRIFKMYEINRRAFSDKTISESQAENALVTEYSKLMSEMLFDFNGKKLPLSVVRGSLEDSDRAVRREAAFAIGSGLQASSEQLDDIFDRLVAIRTDISRKMGYENFIELGYYRMGRLDYNRDMIENFRRNVVADIVPAVSKVKAQTAETLGIDHISFWDEAIYDKGESPSPILSPEEIFAEGRNMYHDMGDDIGDFMDEMLEAEAFDVLARDGKWGGGYCTQFAKYKQPFILANFNGTSGDIDVLTHEFGHALAANNVYKYGEVELDVGGMETAECHSMSMEFFCWRYMDKFFGKNANKYRRKHLLSALSFIPYGCMVDEFQHIVYGEPNLTPKQRKNAWLELERKYRPYLCYEDIPYLSEGTRWQYQMHIYESPFYYIDYCLAQTVALGFLGQLTEDYGAALGRYIELSRAGGSVAFEELVKRAGIASPFARGALSGVTENVMKILNEF